METPQSSAHYNFELPVQQNQLNLTIVPPRVKPSNVRSVAVVGAGLMGTAIAAEIVKQGLAVTIADTDPKTLAASPQRVAAAITSNGLSPNARAEKTVARLLTPTTDDARLARCDLVLESIVESLADKQAVFTRLVPHLSARTILASNTSAIPIGRLAAKLPDPGRFCGIHFLHPVRHRPLVEIVRSARSSDATIAAAVAFVRSIGKVPIVVKDGPGFLVNRLLEPYLTEALELLLDGAGLEQIERVATDFGMAMGPLTVLDEIGMDTVLLGGRALWEAFPDRVIASPLLVTMVKSGRLGRKTGAGFFAYDQDQPDNLPGRPDPKVLEIIAGWARPPQQFDDAAIADRLFLPMVLEATRLLEEGYVSDPGEVDLAMVLGLGFPAARGGLLYWADTLSAAAILRRLRPIESLGPRTRPTAMLLEMAAAERPFYPGGPGLTLPGETPQ